MVCRKHPIVLVLIFCAVCIFVVFCCCNFCVFFRFHDLCALYRCCCSLVTAVCLSAQVLCSRSRWAWVVFLCCRLPLAPLSKMPAQAEKRWGFNMRMSLTRRPDAGLLAGLSVHVDPAVVSDPYPCPFSRTLALTRTFALIGYPYPCPCP